MKLSLVFAVVLVVFVPAVAQAQVIYPGVRYQWGSRGEIFYGGQAPQYLPTNWPVAGTPAARAVAERLGFPEPNYRLSALHLHADYQYRPLMYSDLAPYEEVGHWGFTADDARNEAYGNVPRYQTGGPAVAPVPVAALSAKQVRAKAIPLLDWAGQESAARNPELREALLHEAAKYDPEATARVRRELGGGH